MKLPKFVSRLARSSSAPSPPLSSSRNNSQKVLSRPLKGWTERSQTSVQLANSPSHASSRAQTPNSSSRVFLSGLMNELEQVFRQFDADRDGKISAEELGAVLRSLGDNATDEEANLMLKEIDADGDGFIDLQEFKDSIIESGDGDGMARSTDELRAAFSMFDLDSNGFITPQELRRVLERLGDHKYTVEDCCRMVNGVDRNGDGFVDFEEFKHMMASA